MGTEESSLAGNLLCNQRQNSVASKRNGAYAQLHLTREVSFDSGAGRIEDREFAVVKWCTWFNWKAGVAGEQYNG